MTKTYRVVLLGRMEEKQDFEEKMEKLGFSTESVRDLIEKAPSALKAGLPLGEAREYAEAVQEAGGKVNIQEDGISEELTRAASSHRDPVTPGFYHVPRVRAPADQSRGVREVWFPLLF